jgi:hypothetical protein
LIKSKTTFTYSFEKVVNIPDLYKTEDYADDLENIMHSLQINQIDILDNLIFKRIVTITNVEISSRLKWMQQNPNMGNWV